MTTQDKLIKKKLSLLELSEFLRNLSEACRINGCSRQHFYDWGKRMRETLLLSWQLTGKGFSIMLAGQMMSMGI